MKPDEAEWEITKHDNQYYLNLWADETLISSVVIDENLAKAITDLKIHKPSRILGIIGLGMVSFLIFALSLIASFGVTVI